MNERATGSSKLEIDLGNDLRLEELFPTDADQIVELVADDPEGVRMYGETANLLFSSVATLAKSMERETNHHYIGIKVGDALAGFLTYLTEPRQTARLSYYMGKDYRGQGLTKQALEALIEEFFERQGIYHLRIIVAEANLASQATAKSVGFHNEPDFPSGPGEKLLRFDLDKPGHENDP